MKSVELAKGDVQNAISAMKIDDEGECNLNFFLQKFLAGNFPVYEAYAIHRASEPLSGPRSIIVTK
jgi:hypothetical protein